ncbi:hypothetical protein VE00_10824 [Pseudogymnoascus sp. WSF 3629]|nr:hypothetical protein VE00_10824 [Pseudogymnoascus sp. WSF 3629]
MFDPSHKRKALLPRRVRAHWSPSPTNPNPNPNPKSKSKIRSSILLLAVAATGFAAAESLTDCDKVTELANCIIAFDDKAGGCASDDPKNCPCEVLQGEADCYAKYCPNVSFPGASALGGCPGSFPGPWWGA